MKGKYVLLLIGVALGLVCFRLSAWQWGRLEERREANAELSARQAMPPIELPVRREPDSLHFRRATASGVFDYDYEVIVIARQMGRRPGVHVLTPLVMGDGSAVLVNRGWSPSPDGASVDLPRLRGPDSTVSVDGYLVVPGDAETNRTGADWPLTVRNPNLEEIARLIPYALQPVVLRATPAPRVSGGEIVPVQLPELSEGSHFSYAVQWLIFGTVALVGPLIFVFGPKQRSTYDPSLARDP